MANILICEEHAIIRYALNNIILKEEESCTSSMIDTEEKLFFSINNDHFQVVIIDLSFSGNKGLEIIRNIKGTHPEIQVLAFDLEFNFQFALRSIKAGASGYLTTDSAPEELIKAINKVMDGGKYVNQQLAEILAADIERKAEGPLHDSLSDREYQVMRLIASGRTAKQIADELALSVKTISTYRARLLEKMKMKTNAELTYYVTRNKLIQ